MTAECRTANQSKRDSTDAQARQVDSCEKTQAGKVVGSILFTEILNQL